jgi:hypothetical protein
MNWNLIVLALTSTALGLLATFDIIPGAGFNAGLVMLAIGGTVLGLQTAKRNGLLPLWNLRSTPRAVPGNSGTVAAVRAATPLATMVLLAGVAGVVGASAQDGAPAVTRGVTRADDTLPKRAYTNEESSRLGAEAQRLAEARQRNWDQKMKRLSGSICAGC